MGKIFSSLKDLEVDNDHHKYMEFVIAHDCTSTIRNSIYYQHLEHLIYDCSPYDDTHFKIIFKSNSDLLYVLTHVLFNERIVYIEMSDHPHGHKVMDYKNNIIRIGKKNKNKNDYTIIQRDGFSYYSHPRYDTEYLKLLAIDPLSLFSFEFGISLQQACTQVLHEYKINISTSIRANRLPKWDVMVQEIIIDVCNLLRNPKREQMIPDIFKLFVNSGTTAETVIEPKYFINRLNKGRTKNNIIDASIIKQCFDKHKINFNYFMNKNRTKKEFNKLLESYNIKKGIAMQIWNEFGNKPFVSYKYNNNAVVQKLIERTLIFKECEGIINSCINKCNFKTIDNKYTDNDVMKLLDYTNKEYGEIRVWDICKLLPNCAIQLLSMYERVLILKKWTEKDIQTFFNSISKDENLDYFQNKYGIFHPFSENKSRLCNKTDNCKFNKDWSKPCDFAHGLEELQVIYTYIIKAIRYALDVDFLSKNKSTEWSVKNETDDMKTCDEYKDKIENIEAYVPQHKLKLANKCKINLWNAIDILLPHDEFPDYLIYIICTEMLGYPLKCTPDMYYFPGNRPIICKKEIAFNENKGSFFGVSVNSYSFIRKKYEEYCRGNGILRCWKYVIPPPCICLDELIGAMVMTKIQFKNALKSSIDNNMNTNSNYNDNTSRNFKKYFKKRNKKHKPILDIAENSKRKKNKSSTKKKK
eukprot:457136_1